jgi:hypothetical protein
LEQLITTVNVDDVYEDSCWWGKEGKAELRIYADFADVPSLEEMWRRREGFELGPDDPPRDLEEIWCDRPLIDAIISGEMTKDFDVWRIKGKSTGFIMRDKQWAEQDPTRYEYTEGSRGTTVRLCGEMLEYLDRDEYEGKVCMIGIRLA